MLLPLVKKETLENMTPSSRSQFGSTAGQNSDLLKEGTRLSVLLQVEKTIDMSALRG